MKKVICFTDSLGPGGAQRQLVGLACMLKENGYNVSVLLYYDNPFYKPTLDKAGIESVVIGNTANPIKRLCKLYRYFRKQPCDVVISYQETPSLIASIFRPLFKWQKLIVSERNTTQKLTIKDKLRFWAYRFADKIVPNSYSQADFINSVYPRLSDKVIVITNFVDTNIFVPSVYNVPNSKVLSILTVARITPQKNILRYIEAINIIKNRSDVMLECHWFGDTDNQEYYEDCIDAIKKCRLQDTFYFHPASNDIVKQYQSHDVFCLPSIYEGFPNVICEAMSCGMPILCGNVCDNQRIVKPWENGILFNPLDQNSISATITHFVKMSAVDRSNMAQKSRDFAEQNFSCQRFINEYVKLIKV